MIRLRGLGQCTLEVGDTRLLPAAETLFATALYLVLEGGRPIARRVLMEVLWPTVSERRAAHSLRQVLYRLNGLGAGLRCERMDVLLPAHRLEADCAALLATHDSVELERLAASDLGEFLPGYSPQISAAYAEWLEAYRDRVHSAIRRAFQAGISARRARGDWHGAEALAARCLAIDPLNEEATIAVAESAMAQRSRGEALSVLETFLRDVGGIECEPQFTAAVLRERIAEEFQTDIIPVRSASQTGRESEMAELHHALRLAIGSRGSAYLIWGETGIGKTRLVNEMATAARAQKVRVVQVGCQPHDERRPLSVFVDLVPKLLLMSGSLGCAPESMKYLKRLVEHDPNQTTLSADSSDAEVLFSKVCHSLFDLFDAVSGEGPLLLIVEDAHWLDRMSWELLGDLTAWVGTRQVLLLITSRTEENKDRFTRAEQRVPMGLPLRPLRDEASRQLLDQVIKGMAREGNERFCDWCVSSSGGNPYYLIELALHGAWDGEQYLAPATLDKLVAQRLAGLSMLSHRTLQACCSLGKFSTLERVERVLGARTMELMDSLEDLERRGLIQSDGTRVISKHDLLTKATLSRLSGAARLLMDRRVAEVLEGEATDLSSTALLWECAEHWQGAGEVDRAIRLLRSCARHSVEIGLPAEAARTLARATRISRSSGERLKLANERIHALHLAGEWDELETVILETNRLLRQEGSGESQHTDLELLLFQARWRISPDNGDLLRSAIRCVKSTAASMSHRIRAGTWAIMLADNLCDTKSADTVHVTLRELAHGDAVREVDKVYFEMVYHCAFGDPRQAAISATRLVEISEQCTNIAERVKYLTHAAASFRCDDQAARAIEVASKAVAISEKAGMKSHVASTANQIAATYLTLDDLGAAKAWHSRATAFLDSKLDSPTRSSLLSTGAEIALKEGRLNDASKLIDEGEAALGAGRCLRSMARLAAFRWHVRLLKAEEKPTDPVLTELRKLHVRTRDATQQDLFAAVLAQLYQWRGRSAEGVELLKQYLENHRRVRGPLSAEMKDACALLGVDPDLRRSGC